MTTHAQRAVLVVLVGAFTAITPSVLVYLQARQEIAAKYGKGRDKAEAGYDTVVTKIEGLQRAVVTQHEYLLKLEGQVSVLSLLLTSARQPLTPGTLRMVAPTPPAPERPTFEPAPAFNAIQQTAR